MASWPFSDFLALLTHYQVLLIVARRHIFIAESFNSKILPYFKPKEKNFHQNKNKQIHKANTQEDSFPKIITILLSTIIASVNII